MDVARYLVFAFCLFGCCIKTQAQEVEKIYNQGMDKAMAGKYTQAAKIFTKGIEAYPDAPNTYLLWYNRGLANMYLETINTGSN